MKKIANSMLWLSLAEIACIPIYVLVFIGLAFNDSNVQTGNVFTFMITIYPIYILIFAYIAVYVFFNKKKCSIKVLNFIYVPTRIIIVLILIFSFMHVYMTPEINETINPITYYENYKETKENKTLINIQNKEFEEYQKNKSSYKKLYTFSSDGIQFSFLIGDDYKHFYALYQNKDNQIIKPLNATAKNDEKIEITESFTVAHSDFGEIQLIEGKNAENYIAIPSKNVSFLISRGNYAFISGKKVNFGELIEDYMIKNVQLSELSYQKGILFRTGGVDQKVTWVFLKDEEVVLERNAAGEMSLNLSTLKDVLGGSGNYTCYLTSFIRGEHRKISNQIELELK